MERKKKHVHHNFDADALGVRDGIKETAEMRWDVSGRQSFVSRASSRSLEL